ncbi:MAG: hypothetical protein M3410_04655 [Acidobacteriota bacterium]|nr:hypothetical protein [Acidobacteriota bacterium]
MTRRDWTDDKNVDGYQDPLVEHVYSEPRYLISNAQEEHNSFSACL